MLTRAAPRDGIGLRKPPSVATPVSLSAEVAALPSAGSAHGRRPELATSQQTVAGAEAAAEPPADAHELVAGLAGRDASSPLEPRSRDACSGVVKQRHIDSASTPVTVASVLLCSGHEHPPTPPAAGNLIAKRSETMAEYRSISGRSRAGDEDVLSVAGLAVSPPNRLRYGVGWLLVTALAPFPLIPLTLAHEQLAPFR
jgi:hypothetical protein